MRRNDIEIYHYCDTAPCGVTMHAHDFYEIYCLLNGKMNFLVDGRSFPLEPGTILLVAPGELHKPDIEGPPRDFDRIVLWMNPGLVSSLYGLFPQVLQVFDEQQQRSRLVIPDPKTYQIMLNLMQSLLYEKELADADSPYLSNLILTQLLINISRILRLHPEPNRKPTTRYAAIMKVYEYINQNYQNKINVNYLCEHFFMDRNTLTRQFRRVIGMTPGEYLRRKRLEEAYALIRRGSAVLDAGYQCGFTDYSAFYRAFRAVYGINPSQLITENGAYKEPGAIREVLT